MAGTNFRLQVRDSSIHRRGCFTLDPIPAGGVVAQFMGERISPEEAVRREADPSRPATYTLWLENGEVIDGWVGGNETIYINHACDPNCEWGEWEGEPYVYARRDIAPGEELTIDYAYDPDATLERCLCGAETCRGYINDVSEAR